MVEKSSKLFLTAGADKNPWRSKNRDNALVISGRKYYSVDDICCLTVTDNPRRPGVVHKLRHLVFDKKFNDFSFDLKVY